MLTLAEDLKKLEKRFQLHGKQHTAGAPDEVQFISSFRCGLDADKPAGGRRGHAYFAYDTYKLYLHTGTAWVSTTLS